MPVRTLPFLVIISFVAAADPPDRTTFQTGGPYAPAVDIAADMVMQYGVPGDFSERADSWREQGYTLSMMTGISWGNYEAYYQVDGGLLEAEIQTRKDGSLYMHGDSTTVGYNVPTPAYVAFIQEYIAPAIDDGIRALFLEEPEYWANAGWSEAFQTEWQRHYGEPWEAPDSSVDAQWRASLLKYELYHHALQAVFRFARQRAAENGYELECHVPTHSLINYAHWRIVSPMARLATIPELDGYIAQVWTGTARTPNRYRGVIKERTLETAFFEFGQMANMAKAAGKRVWFLADPIEDNPNYDWNDYRVNYEKTIIASLLWPEVADFEVMPWPNRIFRGQYPARAGSDERVTMPPAYATQLLAVINALNDMNHDDIERGDATQGIGILVSDSMMFQRAQPHPSDGAMSSFYGLAMPLLKAGIPAQPVQLETVTIDGALDGFQVLVLSYEHQKPLDPAVHDALAQWVFAGGSLLYVDDGSDPYHGVRAWWNENGATDAKAGDDLFTKLAINGEAENAPKRTGYGWVRVVRERPRNFADTPEGAERVRTLLQEMLATQGDRFNPSNRLMLRRGPYHILAVLDESISDEPLRIEGRFVDLFDPRLPVVRSLTLRPGQHALLYDLDWARQRGPHVAAGASRIRNQRVDGTALRFTARGPADTQAVLRVALPSEPIEVDCGTLAAGAEYEWDEASSTLLLRFSNQAAEVPIVIRWVEPATK